ncbi:alpha/beta hydrolase [Enterococcus sp. 5H]|uniref:alpha/beta hydrolase n=1 Tax=Enterococcus sp. 5H TaxID=1229490 RepID=UPI002302CF29|nr:alpha/beta hydrolase [Enterococcus sp. 5H]MDA9470006.1 Carboxylesterase [Enterococcus sp. 5H]
MEHIFEEGQAQGKKLLLLHGTGGDETSLLDIANYIAEKPTILSFRGTVQEAGMNRFFKRNGLNQFDLVSLEEESDRLLNEIIMISEEKEISLEDWTIVGYSNGANIAAHLLLERNSNLQQAILFHPMSLGVDTQTSSLSEKKIWLSVGQNDPIVSHEDSQSLIQQLENREAQVTVLTTNEGHQLTLEEVNQAKNWLDKN